MINGCSDGCDMATIVRSTGMTEAYTMWNLDVSNHLQKAKSITEEAIAIKERLRRQLAKASATQRTPCQLTSGAQVNTTSPGSSARPSETTDDGAEVHQATYSVIRQPSVLSTVGAPLCRLNC